MYCFLVFLLLVCVCVSLHVSSLQSFLVVFWRWFAVSLFPYLLSLCLVYLVIWWPQCYLAWPLASLFFFLGWYIWYGLQLTSTVLWRSLEHRKKLLSGEAERTRAWKKPKQQTHRKASDQTMKLKRLARLRPDCSNIDTARTKDYTWSTKRCKNDMNCSACIVLACCSVAIAIFSLGKRIKQDLR